MSYNSKYTGEQVEALLDKTSTLNVSIVASDASTEGVDREVKDAKDLDTGLLVYIKGHAKTTYMSDGSTLEDCISKIMDVLTSLATKVQSGTLSFAIEGVAEATDGVLELNKGTVENRVLIL